MSTKSKQETKNTYQYIPTPVTPEVTEAKTVSQNLKGQINPRIRSQFAGMRQEYQDSFDNPMGAYTTQAVRDASIRSKNQELGQAEAQTIAEADYLTGLSDFDRQMAIAQMTAPRLVQTGGTTTGTQSGGITQALIGGTANVAGSFLG